MAEVSDPSIPPRIGVFGGTFDPPHIGHLAAAVNVRHALGLDRMLLTVANVPWQKADRRQVTPAVQRLAMVRLAVEGLEGLEASDLEIRRGGATYTVDTVQELLSGTPGAEVYVVVGRDAAAVLDTWHRHELLLELARLVVIDRPGAATDGEAERRWGARPVAVPALDVSSTELRRRVAAGEPLDVLTPSGVMRYVGDQRLYRFPDD